jgi:hypothetical protein
LPICLQPALSNDVPMSPPKDSDRPEGAAPDRQAESATDGQGVLSKLPRTRPQRTSQRRAAARAASAATKAAEVAKVAAEATVAGTAPVSAARANGRPPARVKRATAARPAKKPAPASGSNGAGRARRAGTRAAKRTATKPVVEPAPRQGFESETERANGTVHPPGGADLVASAAEIVGELAKAGVSTGERLLKDLLSHLPLS